MECRLVVDFDIPGVPIQHYRAERCAAEAFAAEATRQGLARVTVDNLATDNLRELPYQRLYLPDRRNDHPHGPHPSINAVPTGGHQPDASDHLHRSRERA